MSTWELLAELPVEIEDYALEAAAGERLQRLRAQEHRDPPARRGRGGRRRGRHLRRRRPRDPAGRRPGAAARRAASRSRPSAEHLAALDAVPASRRSARSPRATARGRTSRRRSTWRCARPGRRCTRRSGASRSRCASSSRCASASRRRSSRVRSRLELYPGLRFKLDPTSSWDEALIAELVATGRGRLGRLQGPTTRARSSTSRPTRCSTGASSRRSRRPGSRTPR